MASSGDSAAYTIKKSDDNPKPPHRKDTKKKKGNMGYDGQVARAGIW